MSHMTLQGQPPTSDHMQTLPDFRHCDSMSSLPQFEPTAKDFVPPDPLEMRPGMYIPPEETATMGSMEPTLDDLIGWQSDEEQQDTDEDEEDNVFDMEFDDPELSGMGPIQAGVNPMVCERHLSQPNFSAFESSSSPSYLAQQSFSVYPVMTRYEYEQQPGYKAPFNFIDPSSLQLRSPSSSINAYTTGHSPIETVQAAGDSDKVGQDVLRMGAPALQAPGNGANTSGLNDPLVNEPLDLSKDGSKALEDIDLDMDMDFAFGDSRDESEPLEQYKIPQLTSPLSSPALERSKITPKPETEVESSPQAVSKHTPEPSLSSPSVAEPMLGAADVSEYLHTPLTPPTKEPQASVPTSPTAFKSPPQTRLEEPNHAAFSPPPEKPRKRTARRVARSGGGSASHHGPAHVCNMTFSDGRECHRSFTRPYDLARHQETIHAPVRRAYKCDACGDRSKTFSRLDALSRHMRLKHSA